MRGHVHCAGQLQTVAQGQHWEPLAWGLQFSGPRRCLSGRLLRAPRCRYSVSAEAVWPAETGVRPCGDLTGPGAHECVCSREHALAGRGDACVGDPGATPTVPPRSPEEPVAGAGVWEDDIPMRLSSRWRLGPRGWTQCPFFKKVRESENRCRGRLSTASFPRALLGGRHHRGAPHLLPGHADAV